MRAELSEQVATLFGIGKIPGAPGTWGSLVVAFPALLGSIQYPFLPWMYAGIALGCTIAGLFVVPMTQERWGKDASCIVIDEAAGMALVLSVPLSSASPTWLLAAFLLFRMYDIAKPFPANWLDKRVEGWAVIADDLIAGVYAVATLYLWHFVVHAISPVFLS